MVLWKHHLELLSSWSLVDLSGKSEQQWAQMGITSAKNIFF